MTSTIRDVARRAGVSTATVSRVLSGASHTRPETARRVTEAAGALEYRPSGVARSLKLRRTRTLGLLVTDIQNPFYPEIVRAVEDAAQAAGLSLVLCNGAEQPDREARYLELLLERRVDGILVCSSRLTERHAHWLERAPIPIVVINSLPPVPGIPAILSDNEQGGRLAAEHVLALGHRRIGYLADPAASLANSERLTGARNALAGHMNRATATTDPAVLRIAEGDGHVAGGEAAMRTLMRGFPDTSAVLCHNDLTAIGALRALRAAGSRVPGDVSVVGFDDIDLSGYVDPALTTVVQQKAEMGRWAVEALARRMAGAQAAWDAEVVRMPVSLRVRASTAPPDDRPGQASRELPAACRRR
jgi:DNA-binding LacI/PurR family transcriptional regulator